MSENQNYSELKWSFADFIKRLDSILVKDSSGVDFMLEFIDNCIKDGVDNPLRSKNRSNETRYLNDEKFSKKKAEFIKNNFNLKKLSDYLESIFDNNDNDDNVNDLCEEFFPNNQNVTYKNLAEELTKLFLEILRKRIEEIDPRPREKYEVFIPLGEEKVFENKIKETVKAIYAIASSDELKDHPISATYIKKKIPDDFLLQDDVQHKVTKFFNKINQYFVDEQREGAIPADFVTKQVHEQYVALKATCCSKQEIFNEMTSFFLTKAKLPTGYNRAAQCVVAYFIQLCEVFDVSAE
ncbi:MAG: hypothetical protein K6G09_00390 [Treponema sp.]|nr:hypothetical protein [Treponema sp.]